MTERLRDFRPAHDEPAVAELWERCFGRTVGGQTPEWMFRSGAAGPCPRSVAVVDDRIVAHAGVTALRFQLAGEEVSGGYSVGAMTDPDFRGRGLFARLGAHLYDRLEREGFAFVAGFSNAQSHRLMVGPLGRTALEPFPWCIRILRPAGLLRGLLQKSDTPIAPPEIPAMSRGELSLASCAVDDDRVDALWDRVAPSVRVGAVRNSRFYASRFATRPEAGYRALGVERDQQMVAFAVHRTLTIRGQKATFLLDVLVAPDALEAGRWLLQTLARAARGQGAALLSALLPGEGQARKALRRTGFLRIPEALQPQAIHLSVRGLGPYANSPLLPDLGAWLLSWADTDVV